MKKITCSNCKKELSLKDRFLIFNNKCPFCNSKLKISIKSTIVYFLIALPILAILMHYDKPKINLAWLLFCILILKPIILRIE